MKRILASLFALTIMLALNARSDTCVYFVNIYPGSEIFTLDGHSAILVDIAGHEPQAYNFGVFDFNSPNFVYRFVKGETDYMAVEWPWRAFVEEYRREGRRVVAHRLNFDSAQKKRLIEALRQNVRPENASYRYNYVKDNCATRPLRAVELAAGDSIKLPMAPFESQSSLPMTFRNIMRKAHANYPWYQFGIDLALGYGIDSCIDRRAAAFSPIELDGMLGGATVGGRPLVAQTVTVNDVAPDAAIDSPTPLLLTPDAVGWLIFAVALVLTIRDLRRRSTTRIFDAIYFGIIGLGGCVIAFLVFISVHEATSPNLILAWVNPLCLLVPALIWLKSCNNFLICYQIVNFAVLLALLLSWPWLPQSANTAFLPLILAEMLRSASFALINRIK